MEIHRIPGIPEYGITADGRIYSYPKYHFAYGRWLTACRDSGGYMAVSLAGKTRRVHRLLALTFLPNPSNKALVNHKNGVKHDNRLENLEWTTPGENLDHALRTGLSSRALGEENGRARLTAEQVRAIKGLLRRQSVTQIAKQYCVSRGAIRRIENGTSWRHVDL